MYTEYYQLREKPFSLSPDPRFLYLSTSHREALAHVLYGIDQGEGFIAVTGEVGTGKTTLCRTLLGRMGGQAEVAFLFNPSLSGEELVRTICVELGLPIRNRSRAALAATRKSSSPWSADSLPATNTMRSASHSGDQLIPSSASFSARPTYSSPPPTVSSTPLGSGPSASTRNGCPRASARPSCRCWQRSRSRG